MDGAGGQAAAAERGVNGKPGAESGAHTANVKDAAAGKSFIFINQVLYIYQYFCTVRRDGKTCACLRSPAAPSSALVFRGGGRDQIASAFEGASGAEKIEKLIKLNRLILEQAYPLKCPKMQIKEPKKKTGKTKADKTKSKRSKGSDSGLNLN